MTWSIVIAFAGGYIVAAVRHRIVWDRFLRKLQEFNAMREALRANLNRIEVELRKLDGKDELL